MLSWYSDAKSCVSRALEADACRIVNIRAKLRIMLRGVAAAGIHALSDAPYVYLLPQLLELAPRVEVAMSMRDPLEWAKSRLTNHGYDLICTNRSSTHANQSDYALLECCDDKDSAFVHACWTTEKRRGLQEIAAAFERHAAFVAAATAMAGRFSPVWVTEESPGLMRSRVAGTVVRSQASFATGAPRHFLSVCVLIHNVADSLLEFIRHYLEEGFDHIYILDDRSTDGFESLLMRQVPSYRYSVHRCSLLIQNQAQALSTLLPVFQRDTRWIFVCDVDEFVSSRAHPASTVRELLESRGTPLLACTAIRIPWVFYSWGQFNTTPSKVRSALLWRQSYDNVFNETSLAQNCTDQNAPKGYIRIGQTGVKSLFQPAHATHLFQHFPESCWGDCVLDKPQYNRSRCCQPFKGMCDIWGDSVRPTAETSDTKDGKIEIQERQVDHLLLAVHHYRIKSFEDLRKKQAVGRWAHLYRNTPVECMNRLDIKDTHGMLVRATARADKPQQQAVSAEMKSQAHVAPVTPLATAFIHFSGTGGTAVQAFIKSTMSLLFNVSEAPYWYDGTGNKAHGVITSDGKRLPCQSILQHAHTSQFYRFENPVIAPLFCPYVAYWTVLRDPVDRIFARLFKPFRNGSSSYKFISVAQAKAALNRSALLFPTPRHEFTGIASLNNWYIRSLCGPDVYNLPLNQVTRDHLAAARTTLSRFDLVVLTQNLSSLASLVADQLRVPLFRWNVSINHVTSGRSSETQSTPWHEEQRQSALMDKVFMNALRQHNELDNALYAHAEKLFHTKMASILATPIATRWMKES